MSLSKCFHHTSRKTSRRDVEAPETLESLGSFKVSEAAMSRLGLVSVLETWVSGLVLVSAQKVLCTSLVMLNNVLYISTSNICKKVNKIKQIDNVNNKIMFTWTRSLFNAFRQLGLTVHVRINIISKLFRPVKKSNSLISNGTAEMILSSFCIILTNQ